MILTILEVEIWSDSHPPIRMSTSSAEMLEGEEGSWGLDEAEEASSYLVLTLRLRLNLVRYFPFTDSDFPILQKEDFQPYLVDNIQPSRFCLICGKSLHEGLVSPLDHILTSSCFVNTERGKTTLEVQLHPEQKQNQKNGILNDGDWSDKECEEEGRDESKEDAKPAKKLMNGIARERHCCSECPAFFHSPVSLDQHHRLNR